jgi:hypothetical protein
VQDCYHVRTLPNVLHVAVNMMLTVPQLRPLVTGSLLLRPGFQPRQGHVELLVDEVVCFLQVLRFPLPVLIPEIFSIRHNPSFGARTVGSIVFGVQSGLCLTPNQKYKTTRGSWRNLWPAFLS